MTEPQRINISEHTNAICALLSLDPRFVREMTITPGAVVATVYRKNENGSKYIEQGEPACDAHRFQVTT